MTGAGGFSANINNGRTFRNHICCVLFCLFYIIPLAPVRKRIRGYIENSHNGTVLFHIKHTISDFHHKKFLLAYTSMVRFFFSVLHLHSACAEQKRQVLDFLSARYKSPAKSALVPVSAVLWPEIASRIAFSSSFV